MTGNHWDDSVRVYDVAVSVNVDVTLHRGKERQRCVGLVFRFHGCAGEARVEKFV